MAVRILAADDSATMRRVLEMTFAGEAVDIETVAGGEAAVERASQAPPDIVIADSSMGMDGYQVARALKSQPGTQNVAVIVLVSQHHPYDAERGTASGVDDHILKPYDSQAMIDKARDVLSKPRASASASAAALAPTAPQTAPRPQPPAQPAAAQPPRPPSRTPGAGRPGAGQGLSPRSTVAFGAVAAKPPMPPESPSLELDEVAPPRRPAPAAAAPPAAPAPPERPPARHAPTPAARQPSGVTPGRAAPERIEATPAPAPAAPAARAAASAASSATRKNGDMAAKLNDLGLDQTQIEGVLRLSREVIERVVWEVVPDLAEVIIREEIKRLTSD